MESILIAFEACNIKLTEFEKNLITKQSVSLVNESILSQSLIFSALEIDRQEFESEIKKIQDLYQLSWHDIIEVIKHARKLRKDQSGVLEPELDIRKCKIKKGFLLQCFCDYISDKLEDIFYIKDIEYTFDFREKSEEPFTFEGDNEFFELVYDTDIEILTKIVSHSNIRRKKNLSKLKV